MKKVSYCRQGIGGIKDLSIKGRNYWPFDQRFLRSLGTMKGLVDLALLCRTALRVQTFRAAWILFYPEMTKKRELKIRLK
jgi:hypothetical protein